MHDARTRFQDDGNETHAKRLGSSTVHEAPSRYFEQTLVTEPDKIVRQTNA